MDCPLYLFRVFYFMKIYLIKSPSGKQFIQLAESIYHAVELVKSKENHQFTNKNYLTWTKKQNLLKS